MDDGDGGRDHVDGPSYLSLSWYRFHADARADEQCSRQNSKYQSVRLLYLCPPRMAQHLQILPRALRESVSFSELTSGMIISKCGNKIRDERIEACFKCDPYSHIRILTSLMA